jgi:VIT1/CCC1 family predicted Fe2+/Mn2+ transporter
MASTNDIKRYKENLKAEKQAILLYTRMSEAEQNQDLAAVYSKLVETEKKHAEFWGHKLSDAGADTLAREELGIDPKELGGSAWEAGITSFLLFTVGAVIPVMPYMFLSGMTGIAVSAVSSTLALFIIGAIITLMTGRHPVISGIRQVLFGLATATITFSIGHFIGVYLG